MYTLGNADAKTSIAVLKSDIFQVHLRLQKMKNLINKGERPQSRRRSEISAIKRGTSEVEEIIKSFPSEDVNQLRYQLVLLLNEKMIELESVVFKLTSKQRDSLRTPSMSRLPVWLKLLDRHVEICCPESVSRPASRCGIPQPVRAVTHDCVSSLLKKFSVDCAVKPSSPEFLNAAVAAIGVRLQEQRDKLEKVKIEDHSKARAVKSDNPKVKSDIVAAEQNIERLTSRMEEVEMTRNVRKLLTKEINKLQSELASSKKSEKYHEDKCDILQAEANNASNRISELLDKLKVCKIKENQANGTTQSEPNTWEMVQIRSSHDEEIKIFKERNRAVVKQLMQSQEANRDLVDILTNKDDKLKELEASGEHSFYEAITIEIRAMKEAFEMKIANLKKELELARADRRRVNQQLKDQHESHHAALEARAELLKFSPMS